MKNLFITLILCLLLTGSIKSQVSGSFMFDGISRSWVVYLPVNYSPGNSYPLLLALHGLTQTGAGMMQFTGFNSIADTANFIVAYPNGIGNAWNVGFAGGSTADDVGFLSALIDTLHQDYNIDLNRVYATGFSNGGFLCYRLACELGDRVAAIAPVSGTMTDGSYTSCSPQQVTPVLHIHGTSDIVVNYNGGFGNISVDQVLTFWNSYNNCAATPQIENLPDLVAEGSTVQRYTWAPCSESAEVMLLKVINGGHTWPGSVGVTGLGNTNRDISASGEIWKFVSRFSLAQTTLIHSGNLEKVEIYPNPVTGGSVVIESPKPLPASVLYILTAEGSTVMSQKIPQNATRISVNTSYLKPGFYLALISDAGYRMQSKFVVQ
ncbi:MAG: PHB depolymerase family esterase [Bacteroidota bacterium]